MKRREFTEKLLATITGFALMDSLYSFNAIGHAIKPITDHWAITLNEYCQDLKTDSISVIEWQQNIQELYAKIELQELLQFIEFDNLIKGFQYPDLGVSTKSIIFPKLKGLPEKTVFLKKIFGMKKNRAIIPHCHSNMASAHLILNGEMHLRHYEKIQHEGQSLIIEPSIDHMVNVGDHSTISDQKNNIHWFIANTETAFTFDVIMLDLNDKGYDIQNLDIYESEDLKNGRLRVPILDVNTALKKYGKQHH